MLTIFTGTLAIATENISLHAEFQSENNEILIG